MHNILIRLTIILIAFSTVTFAADPVSFRLSEETFAFDSIKTHKALWITMATSSDDNGAELQRLLIKCAAEGKILKLPAGTAITVNGRSNGLVVESVIERTPGKWLVLVKALNAAGIPSPKLVPDFND